jgi:hypothetical protein
MHNISGRRSYAHKDQAETGILFELIARRYEYRSKSALQRLGSDLP